MENNTIFLLIAAAALLYYFYSEKKKEGLRGIASVKRGLTQEGLWQCIPPYHTPVRRNARGDVECMSANAKDCMWSSSEAGCNMARIANANKKLRPLECGEMHRQRYGSPGYEKPTHWCAQLNQKL